jgi:hypothetical protein
MSSHLLEEFRFGDRHVTISCDEYWDLVFPWPELFCEWLLANGGWRNLDEACWPLHPDHVQMLAEWAMKKAAKLPPELRQPVDGTVRDFGTLLRYLAAAFSWKAANHRLEQALNQYDESAPTIATEEAVREAGKALIDAALEYPPPYRDGMVRRSLAWADFVDRRWVQGLNIPPPWCRPARRKTEG